MFKIAVIGITSARVIAILIFFCVYNNKETTDQVEVGDDDYHKISSKEVDVRMLKDRNLRHPCAWIIDFCRMIVHNLNIYFAIFFIFICKAPLIYRFIMGILVLYSMLRLYLNYDGKNPIHMFLYRYFGFFKYYGLREVSGQQPSNDTLLQQFFMINQNVPLFFLQSLIVKAVGGNMSIFEIIAPMLTFTSIVFSRVVSKTYDPIDEGDKAKGFKQKWKIDCFGAII